jgi:23S rRNA (guanine1835-N2)-methyltransferase
MFPAGRLVDGTRLLAESATVEDGDRVLDLCCGAGPLGLYAAVVADCSVTLTDDSRVATRAAACGFRAAGVEAGVVTADSVLPSLLDGVRRVLRSDGERLVVHHRDLDLRPHLRGYGSVTQRNTGEEHVVVVARQ